MEKGDITFKETVEIFIHRIIPEIWQEDEVPRINFKFEDNAYSYFEFIKNNPYIDEETQIQHIEEKDIYFLKRNFDENAPTIHVRNYVNFFNSLRDIAFILKRKENMCSYYNYLASIMKRIWLRMGPNDFYNVEAFLEKEVKFINEDLFVNEYIIEKKISQFNGKEVYAESGSNSTHYETFWNIAFFIKINENEYYNLPCVHYALSHENGELVCYIYGVQNHLKNNNNKKIIKELYELNKGIVNPDVHPRHVYSLILFLKLLSNHGIKHIKVPTFQVLSYHYHELLSKKIKNEFERTWPQERIDSLKYLYGWIKEREEKKYQIAVDVYNRFVDKQDIISKNKTEGLINLIIRMKEHIENIDINVDIENQDWMLDIKMEEFKLKTKKKEL